MSGKTHNTHSIPDLADFSAHLAAGSPESLQAELDTLLMSTDGSEEELARIDAYLAELDKKAPLAEITTPSESLADFHTKHAMLFADTPASQPAQPARKRLGSRRIAVIAAVVAVVAGLFLVQATGYHLPDRIARWSSETFGLSFGPGQAAAQPNPECLPLRQALADAGITASLAPDYLPEGFVQAELYAEPDGTSFYAGYARDDQYISIQFRKLSEQRSGQIEKDSADPEIYKAGGLEHYVMLNTQTYLAVWENGGYECSIFGVPDKAELCTMIDSIYWEDLQ